MKTKTLLRLLENQAEISNYLEQDYLKENAESSAVVLIDKYKNSNPDLSIDMKEFKQFYDEQVSQYNMENREYNSGRGK